MQKQGGHLGNDKELSYSRAGHAVGSAQNRVLKLMIGLDTEVF